MFDTIPVHTTIFEFLLNIDVFTLKINNNELQVVVSGDFIDLQSYIATSLYSQPI